MPRSARISHARFLLAGWLACVIGLSAWVWKTPVASGDTNASALPSTAPEVAPEARAIRPASPRPPKKKRKGKKKTRPATGTPGTAFKSEPIDRESGPEDGEDEAVAKRFDSPGEAHEYYLQRRLPEGMTALPVERYIAAREQADRMEQYSTVLGQHLPSRNVMKSQGDAKAAVLAGNWSWLGPGNIGGRTRAILIDPNNPNTMYAAGVAGGVWKSTNAGGNWTPLTDTLSNIAVCSLAMDPTNSNIIYAGTGEGVFNSDAVRGAGIFKTIDGGANWTYLTNTNTSDFFYVNKLVVSPNNASRVYAATRTGIMRSTDGGTNWTSVYSTTVNGGVLDLVIRTDQSNDYLFATVGSFAQASILRNTNANGAGTWDTVYTEAGMGRTSLAIAKSNQSVVYALSASIQSGNNYNNGLFAVFRSTANGDSGSWTAQVRNTSPTKLNTALLSNTVNLFNSNCGFGADAFLNQGWYDNCLAVDPTNENIVYCGGVDAFRSDDGGANWGQMSHWWAATTNQRYVHADHHVIIFHPQFNGTTNQTIYYGTDGGIFRSDNVRAATATGNTGPCNTNNGSVFWTSLNNGYGVTQYYNGAVYPGGQTYFGGAQDNGTTRGTDAGGPNAWTSIIGGDGAYVAVDPTNVNNIYGATQNASLRRSGNGGSFIGATIGLSDDRFQFITPMFIDPNNPQRFWTGGRRMWRSDNGQRTWRQASADLFSGTLSGVTAIAVSPSNSNLVVAGRGGGPIFRTTNALSANNATVWASSQPRTGFVSWVTFDPNNSNIVYATYSTFGDVHVWKSIDGGATWSGLDGVAGSNIPDVPVHCILVDPTNSQRLFVGTDIGVFTSDNGGTNWMVENTGFANTVTETLVIEGTNLFAFTHGRGAYRAPLLPTANSRPVVTAQPQSSLINSGTTATLSVTATGTGLSYQWYQGEAPDTSSPVNGAINSSFTTPALTTRARYWVRVTNGNGFANSTTATVNAEPSPSQVGGLPVLTGTPSVRTDSGVAFNGADASFVLGGTTGFGAVGATTVAEDFTVPAGGWNPASVTFYGYQTGTFASPPVSTLTGVTTLRLYNGVPGAGGTIIGTASTTTILSNAWSGVYRVSSNTTDTTRPIMAITVQWPFGQLAAGTYWIEWALSGSLASGPFVPHNTTTAGAPARQFNTTTSTFGDLADGATPVSLPFVINGTTGTQCGTGTTPAAASFTNAGGTTSTSVVVPAGCNWTATSNASWITLPGATSGTGSGGLFYTVAPNRGIARVGTITISGQTFTINQAAPSFRGATPGQYRPSNGFVYVRNTNDTGIANNEFFYGVASDIPIAGDWNGDGVDTIGIYRNGQFFLRNSNNTGVADINFAFGTTGDIPIAGDWDGDGIDTIGLVRGNLIFLRNSNTGGAPDVSFAYGNGTDLYIAGDWNGDGIDTIGCFRPTNGFVYLRNTNTTGVADVEFFYGIAGDKPVAGDWNADGIDTIGIVRGNEWFLRNTNTTGFADINFVYGTTTDIPIVGDWDGF
jgi:hypothetical protein